LTRVIPPKPETKAQAAPDSLREIKEQERNLILAALARIGGKIYGADGAAALLGVAPFGSIRR
jgi:hypothetical protein